MIGINNEGNTRIYPDSHGVATREQLMELLKQKFPKMWMKPGEEFDPAYEGQIWTGENSFDNDGLPLFDYDAISDMWVFGVRADLNEMLEKSGWYAECYDPGTYFFAKA